MQNTRNYTDNLDNVSLNNNYLLYEFEGLVLKHFRELSEDVADALFVADVINHRLVNVSQLQLETFNNLSEEIDSIFSKHKLKIIEEVSKSVVNFATCDSLVEEKNIINRLPE